MAEMTEQTERRRIRALTFKGFWYIITGAVLIVYSLTMLGILMEHLAPAAEEHPIGVGIATLGMFITGVVWGGILMWKGFNIIPPKKEGE